MLTKKRMALLTILLTLVFFGAMMFLPESVVGERTGNMLLFAPKIFFLAFSAAIVAALVLMFVFKREFIRWQFTSFNRYKHLLRLLVRRDFVAKYRKSILGVLWSLLNPLLTMLVITMVFSYLFRRSIEYFPAYLLGGQIIYGFFNTSTTRAMRSVIGHEGILKKIYVPKYIFPLSTVMSSLVDVLFSFIAFLIVFIAIKAPFQWTMLLLPIPILYTFVFSLGVAMLLSSMAVFFRDLTYLYGVFTLLLMYLTPIFYPVDILPDNLKPVIGLNPLFQFISYFRNLTLHGVVPDLWTNMVCIGFALASLCCGVYVFMSQQNKYILHL